MDVSQGPIYGSWNEITDFYHLAAGQSAELWAETGIKSYKRTNVTSTQL